MVKYNVFDTKYKKGRGTNVPNVLKILVRRKISNDYSRFFSETIKWIENKYMHSCYFVHEIQLKSLRIKSLLKKMLRGFTSGQ